MNVDGRARRRDMILENVFQANQMILVASISRAQLAELSI
jgi:hypothetical protein